MKKCCYIINLILILVLITLVPFNLFLVKLPEWIIWIPILLLIIGCLYFVVKFKSKLLTKIVLLFISILGISFSIVGSYCNPYWNSMMFGSYDDSTNFDTILTYEEATYDLEEMMYYLKKCHPLFLRGIPEKINQIYLASIKTLQNEKVITTTSLYREMQRILSTLSDGHTTIFDIYPNDLYLLDKKQRTNNGWTLTKINGLPLDTLFNHNKDLFSYETKSWGMECLKSQLSSLSGLTLLEINPVGVTYTWQKNDIEESSTYTKTDFVPYDEYKSYNNNEEFVSYTIDSKKDLAILTLKSCEYNNIYTTCLNDMFKKVKEKNIKNVAIDLRDNGGGSSYVAEEFIRYLNIDSYTQDTSKWRFGMFLIPFSNNIKINSKYESLTFHGNVYVLTNTKTFSSAMLFSEYIKDNKLGTMIGEPPGNTPNGYGEVTTFKLKNSGLYFQVSTKEFKRINNNTKDNLIMPDIECKSNQAMNTLYSLIK